MVVILLLAMAWFPKLRAPAAVPSQSSWHLARAAIQSRLEHTGENHLVLVRYAPNHDFYQEWVYNAPDIDKSPVIWAQPLDPKTDADFLHYYAGRKIWILDPDQSPPKLTPWNGHQAKATD